MNTQNRGRRKGGPKNQQNQPRNPHDKLSKTGPEKLEEIAYCEDEKLLLTPDGGIVLEREHQEYFHKGKWRTWKIPITLQAAGIDRVVLNDPLKRLRLRPEREQITYQQ